MQCGEEGNVNVKVSTFHTFDIILFNLPSESYRCGIVLQKQICALAWYSVCFHLFTIWRALCCILDVRSNTRQIAKHYVRALGTHFRCLSEKYCWLKSKHFRYVELSTSMNSHASVSSTAIHLVKWPFATYKSPKVQSTGSKTFKSFSIASQSNLTNNVRKF